MGDTPIIRVLAFFSLLNYRCWFGLSDVSLSDVWTRPFNYMAIDWRWRRLKFLHFCFCQGFSTTRTINKNTTHKIQTTRFRTINHISSLQNQQATRTRWWQPEPQFISAGSPPVSNDLLDLAAASFYICNNIEILKNYILYAMANSTLW